MICSSVNLLLMVRVLWGYILHEPLILSGLVFGDQVIIAAASKATRLVYVPSQIEVTHSDSTKGLSLDASGCLVEDPEGESTVVAPMNLNNMGFVVENCLKQGRQTGFSAHSWHEVLLQHGASPVAGGWFLLIEAVEGKGRCYTNQKAAVEGRSLEVSFLPERVWGEFCRFIQTGKAPGLDPENSIVRTATVTREGTTPYQISLRWADAAGPSLRLSLYLPRVLTPLRRCGGGGAC